ncbi:hypothetical protein MGN70_000589 [Eutypa lata]|nr:hypothetical protein MGN70_000589 [Eutypa lata]
MSKFKNMQNGGKRQRRSLDQWDRQSTATEITKGPFSMEDTVADYYFLLVMDRDRRLTGLLRGQSDAAIAPPGFELNNAWRVEKRFS